MVAKHEAQAPKKVPHEILIITSNALAAPEKKKKKKKKKKKILPVLWGPRLFIPDEGRAGHAHSECGYTAAPVDFKGPPEKFRVVFRGFQPRRPHCCIFSGQKTVLATNGSGL